ncbi:MAG: hypothetical protein KA218_01720 [Arenimonas sp.]|nr:hypothetical protein [Arenimonas sp.]
MKNIPQKITSLIVIALAATSCTPKPKSIAEASQINQDAFCVIVIPDPESDAKLCKVGQKILFKPMQWGNEQFPIRFAAEYCDLRYSVVLTTGAVTCIYKPAKVHIP